MLRLFVFTFLLFVLLERGTATFTKQQNNKVGVLKKHSSGSRNAGDIYIATIKGVYLKYVGTHDIKKIEGITEVVTDINIDFNGGAYATTSNGKLYYIDREGVNDQGVQSYIPYPVRAIGILKEKSTGLRNAGDLYIGTTNGVYLKYVGTHVIKKIEDIKEAVAAINIDFNGGAYITTLNGKLYYIDENGDSKGHQDYIPDRVLTVCVLEKQPGSPGYREAGDVYIGTPKGVYLKLVGTHDFTKVDRINEPIDAITSDFDGSAVVTTSNGKVYYLDYNGDNTGGVQNYITDRVLTVSCLKENSAGSRQAGDWYIGTNRGVYLKNVGTQDLKKINGINEAVVEIDFDYNGAAYVVTQNGKLYYLDVNGDNTQGVQNYIPYRIQ